MNPARQPTVTATLLRYLATASKHRVMYPAEHPIVKRAMDDLVQIEPASAYDAGHLVAQELHAQAGRRQSLDINKARVFLSAAFEVVLENRWALLGLMTGKNYDESSSYHAVNVAILALLVGTRLGLERDALMALGMGALLHDVGKVRVPRDVLNRATTLSARDQEI